MKAETVFRPAVWAGMAAILLGMQPAFAEPVMYVPLGGEDKIVVVDTGQDKVVDAIEGVAAVHGLAGTPDGRFLVAGSFEEREAKTHSTPPARNVTEAMRQEPTRAQPWSTTSTIPVITVTKRLSGRPNRVCRDIIGRSATCRPGPKSRTSSLPRSCAISANCRRRTAFSTGPIGCNSGSILTRRL